MAATPPGTQVDRFGVLRNAQGQAVNQNGQVLDASGAPVGTPNVSFGDDGLTPGSTGAAPGTMSASDQAKYLQSNTQGANASADVNQYMMGGNLNWAPSEANRLAQLANTQGRQGASIDTSTVQPWQAGSAAAIGGQMGQATAIGGISSQLAGNAAQQGAGMGLQGQAGQGLLALGQAAPGPSAAEMAMRANNDQAVQGQQSIAAGVRGGNSGLALSNAANNSAQLSGNLNQQVGVQRANEALANEQFRAGALSNAANVFGQQTGQQTNTLGAAGQVGSAAGSTFGSAAGNATANANTNANTANANAGYQQNQHQLNDQTGLAYNQASDQLINQQTSDLMQFDQNRLNAYNQKQATDQANEDKTGRGTMTGSAGGDKWLGVGMSAASMGLMSDVRAKKDVKPADDKISDGFRAAADSANQIRGAEVAYPNTGYEMGAPQYGYQRPYEAPPGMDPRSYAPPPPPAAPQRSAMLYAPTPLGPAGRPGMGSMGENNRFGRALPGDQLDFDPNDPRVPLAAQAPSVFQAPAGGASARSGITPAWAPLAAQPLEQSYTSDVRAKKNIREAGPEMTAAFRNAGSDAQSIRDMPVDYPSGYAQMQPQRAAVQPTPLFFGEDNGGTFRDPVEQVRYTQALRARPQPTPLEFDPRDGGTFRDPVEQLRYTRGALADARSPLSTPGYEYEYKDPNSPGARPGPQYGIMAQDLEKTPAGRTVVGQDKKGRKFVDPGRLSLLTAGEVAKQRTELDRLNATIDATRNSKTVYPDYQMGQ